MKANNYDMMKRIEELEMLEKINDIETSDIEIDLEGAQIITNGCFIKGKICYVSLTISSATFADRNVALCKIPYGTKSLLNEPLACNVFKTATTQQVCYVDRNGEIHVRFGTDLSNAEIRINGFYQIN